MESVPTIGGITVMPWPGGFDRDGHFYTYGIDPDMEDDFGLLMIRHDVRSAADRLSARSRIPG